MSSTIPDARRALTDEVRAVTNKATAASLKSALGDLLTGWTVEFHIVDAPRPNGSFMIPFFSRITLRDDARNLRAMGFKVAMKFIPT